MNIKQFFKFIAHSFTIHFSFSGVKNFLGKLKKMTGEEIMKKKHRCLFLEVLLLHAREASFFCAWTLLAVCLFSSTCMGWGTFILLDINEKGCVDEKGLRGDEIMPAALLSHPLISFLVINACPIITFWFIRQKQTSLVAVSLMCSTWWVTLR